VGPIVILVILVIGWQLTFDAANVQPFVMPKPIAVWQSFIASPGLFFKYGLNTLSESLQGLAIGVVVGVSVAALTFQSKLLAKFSRSYSAALMSLPVVAIIPLADVFFGLAPSARIFVVAVGTAPIMVVYTLTGLLSTDQGLVDVFRSCSAGRSRIIWRLYLPSSLPFVMSGLKIALPSAFAIAIIAEFFGGPINTLGTFIQSAAVQSHVADLWGAALMAFIFAAILFGLLGVLDWALVGRHRR
jgi:ABC-type nitrate/sulfonate/bicarbonate transport system permease component